MFPVYALPIYFFAPAVSQNLTYPPIQMYWIKQAEKQPIWTERFNVRATHLIDRRNEYSIVRPVKLYSCIRINDSNTDLLLEAQSIVCEMWMLCAPQSFSIHIIFLPISVWLHFTVKIRFFLSSFSVDCTAFIFFCLVCGMQCISRWLHMGRNITSSV